MMTSKRDWNQTISKLTGWLVGFLALASFVLSYEALWTLALDSKVNFWLAWLWPLTLDFFVLVASLSILKNSLNGKRRIYAWTLVVVFTALSIVFNAIHKGLPIEVYNTYALPYVPMVVYILPPVAFVFSLHLLVDQVGDILKWAMQKVDSVEVAELERLLADAQTENEKLEEIISEGRADANRLAHKLAEMQTEIEEVKKGRDTEVWELTGRLDRAEDNAKALQTQAQSIADWNLLNATAKATWIAQHANGDKPPASALARAIGCAVSTVSRAYEAVDRGNGGK